MLMISISSPPVEILIAWASVPLIEWSGSLGVADRCSDFVPKI